MGRTQLEIWGLIWRMCLKFERVVVCVCRKVTGRSIVLSRSESAHIPLLWEKMMDAYMKPLHATTIIDMLQVE